MLRPLLRTRALRLTLLVAGVGLAVPAGASAVTTVSQSGSTLSIVGDDQPSRISHDTSYTGFQIQDDLGGAVVPASAARRSARAR